MAGRNLARHHTGYRIQQVIVQPTSGCNLNCAYCYVPNRRDYSRMQDETVNAVTAKVLQSEFVRDEVEFVWHAGEPLTAGIQFYERAVDAIHRHNTRNIAVKNCLQTNGVLVDDRWLKFFADNGFIIGISIDGPAFLHDRNRVNWSRRGSHRDTMRGFKMLRDCGLSPGVICVLTRESLCYPTEIFSYFLRHGVGYLCFNLEEVENANRTSSFTSASGTASRAQLIDEYRRFISEFFDAWRPHASQMVVREFRDLTSIFQRVLSDRSYRSRPLETVDLGIITIQKNGDITTFSPELAGARSVEFGNFVVGNILTDTLASIVQHPTFLHMRQQVTQGINNCETSCSYFAMCGGGFASNKLSENGSFTSTETMTCVLHRQTLASVLLEKLTPKVPLPTTIVPLT